MGLGYNDLDAGRIRVVAHAERAGARPIWRGGGRNLRLSPALVAHVRALPPDRPAVVVANRPADQPAVMHAAFPGLATHSVIFVRLDVRGGQPGVLLLAARGVDRFTTEHVRLLGGVREPFAIAMSNARRFEELTALKDRLAEDNQALSADIQRAFTGEIVGADFGLRDVMDQVRRMAPSSRPALLLGETGTGKELIAHAIHMASPRSGRPMVSMQCGALPASLLDSELFGHERGAFTGAFERKRGRFERAHGSTLFLDEVGELSSDAQVKLLRVLQEGRFERIGGAETIEVDVRVIAATHRDLPAMVRDGRFREDLWYRLAVLPIRIPPLRHRRVDIPSLIRALVAQRAQALGRRVVPAVSAADLDRLSAYDWPGNVRELQNVVERALLLSSGSSLTFPTLATHAPPYAPPGLARVRPRTMDEAMADHIRGILEQTRWKISGPGGAAELLAMNPSTLRFRMQKLGIRR